MDPKGDRGSPPVTVAPGIVRRVVADGERLMICEFALDRGATIPPHSHPHEQMGLMVSGTMEFTIAGEAHVFSGNEMYFVPGGVPHAAKGGPGGAVALDAFSPPREEYR